ncbi:MAG: cytosolic protein [Armatimonadetes bacterium]|nr:cytosolic protein [Armatimonadota bacterium]
MSQHYPQFHQFLAEQVVTPFYLRRLQGLHEMRLQDVLKRKNPYLFKAKNLNTSGDLARSIVDAFLSSQEETLFGNLLEAFAIHVAQTLYDGRKSIRKSLDLEFKRDENYFIVSIKSGTAWGNADQIARMKDNFKAARIALRNEGVSREIVAVNGCIYGKEPRPLKTDPTDPDKTYFKHAGQDFWHFLSGDDNLFREIIQPIDEEAREKDAAFQRAYAAKINELTADFSLNFLQKGEIDWTKLVEFVSGREAMHLQTTPRSDDVIAKAENEMRP